MMIGMIGRMGQGKTLSMTALGLYLAAKTNSAVVSRHKINVRGARQVKHVRDIWLTGRSVLMWDEIWIDVDSRQFDKNVDLTRFAMYTRKKEIIVLWTAQHLSQVEKRIRKATDILVNCEKRKAKDPATGRLKTVHRLTILDAHTNQIYKVLNIMHPEKFYGLYDTNEIIEPLQGGKTRAEYRESEDRRPAWQKHRDEVRAQYRKDN